ncbi:MAG TPA: M1 family metallopeptidase [Ohtaekwangia sp.]|nr:M1 family metallopeptidase [Ohtaekwangia sp.]
MVLRRLRFVFCLVFLSAHINAQPHFSKDDTLRGSITEERKWWDLKYYHLKVSVDPDAKQISGSVVIQYKVLTSNQKLQIDLQPPLKIDKILAAGKSQPFHQVGTNAYIVTLTQLQKKHNLESIEVYYSGQPKEAKNPPWDGGFQWASTSAGVPFIATSCQGLGASVWWPCKDHMYDEPDSVLMTVTVPEGLTDVSNGRLRRKYNNGDGTRSFEWFVSNPINNYGINVNITNYVHFADTLNGEGGTLDLDYYVLPENIEKAKAQFTQAKLMLKAFEYWFGPYPFYDDGFKLVETPYLGMEHQSSVTYGNGYQNGYRGRDLSGSGWGLKFDFIIIHESGHEWFANSITYKDIADMWIHESFTNYSESLFIEYYYGKEAATDYVVGTRQHIKNDIPIIGVYNVNQKGSGDMYSKGGNMLHTLRHTIDDDQRFRQILRGLNKTFFHKTVTSAEIEKYISKIARHNYQFFFDQYLRDVRIPTFEYALDDDSQSIKYRWSDCVKGFDMPLIVKRGGQVVFKFKPTREWQEMKLKQSFDSAADVAYIERMFYVKTRSVNN